jgi:hypothetical protein
MFVVFIDYFGEIGDSFTVFLLEKAGDAEAVEELDGLVSLFVASIIDFVDAFELFILM